MPKLTKRTVDAAELRPAPYFIWCTDLPGFGVRVFPSGRRSYYADITPRGGARQRLSLGAHGVLTTEEARRLALSKLGGALRGEDPAQERAARRKAVTVRQLCDRYFEATDKGLILGKRGLPKKPSTLLSDRGRSDRHIIPLLGTKRVADLTTSDMARFQRDVTAGKTAVVEKSAKLRGKAIVKGGRGAAKRTLGLLGGMLTFAISEGIITANPAAGVKKPADMKRSTRLDAATYAALGRALAAWEQSRTNDKATAATRLLALTGCRKGEIERLRWREVDAPGHALRLLDSKEGASVRPIGAAALAVLASVERTKESDWVFPGRDHAAPMGSLKGAFERLVEKAKLQGVTLHTLRHSYASVAGDLGYSESTIAALLGHAAGSITSRYVHHMDTVLVAAANRVAVAINTLMRSSE